MSIAKGFPPSPPLPQPSSPTPGRTGRGEGPPRISRVRFGLGVGVVVMAFAAAGACFPNLGDLTSGGAKGEGGGAATDTMTPGSEGGEADGTADSSSPGDASEDATTGEDASAADVAPRGDAAPPAEDASFTPDGGSTGDGAPPPADAPPADAPSADSTPVDAGACSTSLSSDPANCGSCGHDCLGGTCTNSQCQPIVLAATSGSVGIAIDSSYVYWANDTAGSSGIFKISKGLTSKGTPTAVVTGASYVNVQGLAADGTYVYWTIKTAAGYVQRALPTGASLTTLTVSTLDQPDWIAVTVNGADVVWTNQGSNEIMSTPVNSMIATPKQLNITGEVGTQPAGIALDSTSVYYATKVTGGGEAESVPLDGGAVSVLGADTYAGITVDNANVYWTGGYASPTVSQNVKGGNPSTVQIIASGGALTCPLHLVSDGNNVYFLDQGTNTSGTYIADAGALYRVPVGNSAPLPPAIVIGLTDPQGIVEDATAIYWVTGGTSGLVMKLAK